MAHTPGPWKVVTDHLACSRREYQEVIANEKGLNHDDICSLMAYQWGGEKREDERRANAHLIAAAPDLLEALKRILDACETADANGELDDRINGEILDAANAAIRKAAGIQP